MLKVYGNNVVNSVVWDVPRHVSAATS